LKIHLDAGHGGTDSGAVGNGLYEKNLTLEIIEKINEKLKAYDGVSTQLSRSTDVFVGLSERANMANRWGADVFLSVHINSATDPSARGWQSHIYNGSVDAKTIAYQNVIHENVIASIKQFGIVDRGKKRDNFAVVRESSMPAILTENLFISSPADANLLKRVEFIEAVSEGHVIGLEKFLGLKKSQQPPDTASPSPPGKIYRVQVGAFSDLDNANKLASELKSKGYTTLVTSS
jgi:N-acetylmuramoyl-L-alanine amidase